MPSGHRSPIFMRSFILTLITTCTLFGLWGCGSSQVRPQDGKDQALTAEVSEKVGQLMTEAQSLDSPERDQRYLQAARLLVDAGEDDWARNILGSIDSDILFDADFVDYTLMYSRITIDDAAYFLAQRILTNPRIEQQWVKLNPEFVQTLRERRAELFALLGDSTDSVNERINLSLLALSDEERVANQNAIWQSLMAVPQDELERLSLESTDPIAQGWYTLAAISKNNDDDISAQLDTIQRWEQQWPNHPASQSLPSDLNLLKQLVAERPKVIGLLLPLSGPYGNTGQAVRDGFMAAYYTANGRSSFTPEVRIFDTHAQPINDVYDLAVQDGAELIIGPLLKENVQELNLRLDLPVPTLALNVVDSAYGFPTKLYQFGLPVEDEARQIAQRAWVEGHRNAMVLVQQTETGQRAADTFAYQWNQLGGQVVQRSYFADQADYQDVVKDSLLVSDSERRARDIRRLLGGNIKFEEPRRRQDIDLIFMMARPSEAQLLKPTLNFHFASNVPVYATRHIFSGTQDKEHNNDLNGIRFTTLPWFFDDYSAVARSVKSSVNPSPAYQQFYAIGVDAYRLSPRVKQLEEVESARFYGATGVLRLNPERQIAREQEWVQIVNGVATPLPKVVSDAYVD
ncbi:penicillin-binding protein activator [Aurantivibrio plasticivorans]